MRCEYCSEEIQEGEHIMPFNNGEVVMHYACGMRGVIGSVAHLERRCSCYIPGASEGDPPELTPREAATAALAVWDAQMRRSAVLALDEQTLRSKGQAMTVYYKLRGAHYHARLFSKGALLGALVFDLEEWEYFRLALEKTHLIHFEEEDDEAGRTV